MAASAILLTPGVSLPAGDATTAAVAAVVVLGVVFLDERVHLATLAGLLLILSGSWLATRRTARSR